MKKITTLLLVALLMSGCMTSERRIEKFKRIHCKDFSTTIVKDSIIKIPIYYEDSAAMQLWLACDSLGNVYQTNSAYWHGKYTEVQSALKSNVVYVKTKVTIHDTIKEIVTNTVTKSGANIYTNKLNSYQKFCTWAFPILAIIILLYLFWRLYFKKKLTININPFS